MGEVSMGLKCSFLELAVELDYLWSATDNTM